jgi:predicted phosphate transport protein (TIGR00153 family)
MFGLIPKNENFFVMFSDMSKIIIEGAELLVTMLNNFAAAKDIQKKIKDIEHRGDSQTHETIKKLNRSFITPFDREDIYSLASSLDNILDLIDACAQHIIMYNVDAPTPAAQELAAIILRACQNVAAAVTALNKNSKIEEISKFCVEVNSLENEGDIVCRQAISLLFQHETDPIKLIKWKEIYETLEMAIDKCEDAINILESVVVKNA